VSIALPSNTSSATAARRVVALFAERYDPGDLDVLVLVVSELVTNAIMHGAPPIEVRTTVDDEVVRIDVSDGDPKTGGVRVRHPPADHIGGLGLHLVEMLADRWGTVANASGKTVWADLDLGAGASQANR
jgi:anti-sigma regulatory factor (Ser/Thr protein kinase)